MLWRCGAHDGLVLSSLSPPRRRLFLGLVAAAVVAALSLAAVSVFGASSKVPSAAQVTAQPPGPVLLVPGYGGSETGLRTLAGRLQRAGRVVQILPLPDGGTGDLRTQAKSLAAAATALAAAKHAATIDVVGYSAGGVVARLWVHDFGGAQLARRIVTLGSPQHGTTLASLGALLPSACPLACQQLAPGSDLLAGLNAKPEPVDGPQFVSIWTTADDVVLPPESARLEGAALNFTVQSVCSASTVRHSGLPTDPSVDGMVLAELAAGAPVTLSGSDCARLSS
jgi:triacylglycerol lipase